MNGSTATLKKAAWIIALACVLAFGAMVLAGCSGQGSQGASQASGSAASQSASAQSKEELLEDISKATAADYKSVTVEGATTMPAGTLGGTMAMPLVAKMDLSGDALRVYMAMDMGTMAEVFVDGDKAEAFIDGQPQTTTPAELGMDLSSPDALQSQFGGSFLDHMDTIKDVTKETDGDDTVYTFVFDTDKLAELASDGAGGFQGGMTAAPESMDATMRVGKDGRMSALNIRMTISSVEMRMDTLWYDYDNTVVPALPSVEDEQNASVDPNALYAMSVAVSYGTGQGNTSLVPYTYDDHGNVATYMNLARDGNDIAAVLYASEYDDGGWRTSQTVGRLDGKSDPIEYAITTEKNNRGMATKVTATPPNGENTTTYEYYDNGAVKSQTSQAASGATNTEEFDQDGFRTSTKSESSGKSTETRFTWEKDSSGKATGLTVQNFQDGTQVMEQVCDVKTDAAGNIVQTSDRATGRIIQRVYFQEVDNPSLYASVFNKLKR